MFLNLHRMQTPTKLSISSKVQNYEDCGETPSAVFSCAESSSANVTCPNDSSLTTGDTCFCWVVHTSSERKVVLWFSVISSVVSSNLIPVIYIHEQTIGLERIWLYTPPMHSMWAVYLFTVLYIQCGQCAVWLGWAWDSPTLVSTTVDSGIYHRWILGRVDCLTYLIQYLYLQDGRRYWTAMTWIFATDTFRWPGRTWLHTPWKASGDQLIGRKCYIKSPLYLSDYSLSFPNH